MVDKTIMIVRTDTVPVNVLNDSIATISKISANLAGCILNDVYKPFTLFGQMGTDETGYYGAYYRTNYGYNKPRPAELGEGFTEDYSDETSYKIEK